MTISEIAKYILKHYKDKSRGYSLWTDPDYEDELIQSCSDFFYYEILNWCGCGRPEDAKRCIRDYLDALSNPAEKQDKLKRRFGVEHVYDNELLLCLAYMMDAAGFTEHGSGIGGAWLTKDGEMFLACLKLDKELDRDEV